MLIERINPLLTATNTAIGPVVTEVARCCKIAVEGLIKEVAPDVIAFDLVVIVKYTTSKVRTQALRCIYRDGVKVHVDVLSAKRNE